MSFRFKELFLSLTITAMLFFSAFGTTIVYADDGSSTATPDAGTTVTATPDAGTTVNSDGHHKHKHTTGTEEAPTATATPDASTTVTSEDGQPVAGTEEAPSATATPDAGTTVTSEDAQPATSTEESPVATAAPDAGTTVASEDTQTPATGTEASSTDQTPGTDTSVTSANTAPAAEAPTAILQQVPDNTTVTVLNPDGVALSLASQDAANAIASTYDPIWCPAGQPPTPGANGCTPSYSSFDALLTGLSGNAAYQGAGIIYVQQGNYAGGESLINFDSGAYNLSNIRNFDLTVQGGWNTTTNTVDPAASTTFAGVPISVGTSANPWGGSLTFNNINIMWTGQTALVLNSQSDINLSNVDIARSTAGNGAELNAGGSVNINNSHFDDNANAGAIIKAVGSVNVANSSFSNFSNRNLVDQEQSTGVQITSAGSVSLFNVYANANRVAGASINAGSDVSIGSTLGCANNIINSGSSNANNCSSFSGTKFSTTSATGVITFLGYGLQVFTPATISIDSITANDNFLWGADLNAGGNVTIANSIFNGNTTASSVFIDDTGLLIKSGGIVSLNNVQANDNRLYGAIINATGTGSVNITNSTFSNNKGTTLSSAGVPTFFGYGLQVVSNGSIFLDGVTASNNNLAGAQLTAGNGAMLGDVAISNSTFSSNSTGSAADQQGRGLDVVSNEFVFLTNVTVDSNQLYGANIQSNGDVFLDGNTATNNSLDGLSVNSNCNNVNLNNGTYAGNGQYGLNIINSLLNQTGLPVFTPNNGLGDILQDPGTCVFGTTLPVPATPVPTTPAPTTSGSTTSGSTTSGSTTTGSSTTTLTSPLHISASNNRHAQAKLNFTGDRNVTINSLLADNNASFSQSFQSAGMFGIFSGQYMYVYSTCDGADSLGYGVSVIFIDSALADLGNIN